MEYQATFGIDCGVSHGFGLKSPDYVEQDEFLIADNPLGAIIAAAKQARRFSMNYLSNPDNDFTTVTLLKLSDSNRNLINLKKILKEAGYEGIKRFEWGNEEKLITKCHMLEHLLDLVPKEERI